MSSVLELFGFAKRMEALEEKELSFMSAQEAVQRSRTMLEQLEIGAEFGDAAVYAADGSELLQLQEAMRQDEAFGQMYEIGKMKVTEFDPTEEIYYIEQAFTVEGIPVYGKNAPAFRMMGGVDAPMRACKMYAEVLLSDEGVLYAAVSGALEDKMEEAEKSALLGMDGIRNALLKKFGDVILTDVYVVSDIQLEYLPLVDEVYPEQIRVTPVWCCSVRLYSEEENLADKRIAFRFDAFTGEEIA